MILIALGANLPSAAGPPRRTLDQTLGLFPSYGLDVVVKSRWYRTPAVAPTAQPDFFNGVANVRSALPPEELLAMLHRIEAQFGRVRRRRWEARTLDLDLIDYDGMIRRPKIQGSSLALPHPLAAERAFVLVPLAEIAPAWRHPVSGETAGRLLERLGPSAAAEIGSPQA